MTHKNLLTTALLAALFALPRAAFAQDADAGTPANAEAAASAAAQADVAAGQLANRYAELAGSTKAAALLVGELHAGSIRTAAMGYGEIDNALAMTEALMAADAGAPHADMALDAALDNVLDLRASGMGWGEVAQTLGLDLGQTAGASHQANAAVSGTIQAAAATGASGAGVVDAALDTVDATGSPIGSRTGVNAGASTSLDARARISTGQEASADAGVNARIDAGARGNANAPERPQLLQPVRGLLGGNR